MPDAVNALLLVLAGYAGGAVHVAIWRVLSERHDTNAAYLRGYRDGQRVSGQRDERGA